jgi:hypothetical protein
MDVRIKVKQILRLTKRQDVYQPKKIKKFNDWEYCIAHRELNFLI